MSGGHNDGGVAVDNGAATAIPSWVIICKNIRYWPSKAILPWAVAIIEGALPGQLVLSSVHAPYDPGGGGAATWDDNRIISLSVSRYCTKEQQQSPVAFCSFDPVSGQQGAEVVVVGVAAVVPHRNLEEGPSDRPIPRLQGTHAVCLLPLWAVLATTTGESAGGDVFKAWSLQC